MNLISVVVCTYNRAELLRQCLSSLVRQDTDHRFEFEIIVVNDGSTDRTAEVIADFSARHSMLRVTDGGGRGISHAMNTGTENSDGEWIAFFDDDERTHRSWLSALHACATSANAQVVGGPVRLYGDRVDLEQVGPVCRAIFGEHPPAGWRRRHRRSIPSPAGGNRMVHRSVFSEIGAFDESLVTGGADLDFVFRARRSKVRFGWSEEAWIEHFIDETRLELDHVKRYCRLAGRSQAYLNLKHRGVLYAFTIGGLRLAKSAALDWPRRIGGDLTGNDRWSRDQVARIHLARGQAIQLAQAVRSSNREAASAPNSTFRSLRQEDEASNP